MVRSVLADAERHPRASGLEPNDDLVLPLQTAVPEHIEIDCLLVPSGPGKTIYGSLRGGKRGKGSGGRSPLRG